MHGNVNYNVLMEHCAKADFFTVVSLFQVFFMKGLMGLQLIRQQLQKNSKNWYR